MQSTEVIENAIERHADMVYRILFCHLGNKADSDDAFQDVFLKLLKSDVEFTSDEHLKAYLIKISMNTARNYKYRHFWRNKIELEDIYTVIDSCDNENHEVMEAVLNLPDKYKIVIYMHYYEEYKATEIAGILNMNVNTVYSLLKRGREKLRGVLKGEEDEPLSENNE